MKASYLGVVEAALAVGGAARVAAEGVASGWADPALASVPSARGFEASSGN
jgi:hypothetical protein